VDDVGEVVEVADDCDISMVTVGPLTSTIEYSVAVTVFAAGVVVTRIVWVLSEADIVFVDMSVSVSMIVFVTAAWVEMMVSMLVASGDEAAVADEPPSTGTTE